MQKATTKTKLLAALLTLCMMLSLTAFTAYAGELPKPDYLPEGVTYSNDYDHKYHTQVNVTANVSVKDSDGTVVETTQVSKSTEEFLKGGVGMLQSNVARLQTEIETPYQDKGTLARENESGQSILDHFESAELYTFIPTSGDPVEFGMDLDAAKKYFNEHPDATGTFTEILDLHEYQKYNYTYDLNVQQTGQPESTITAATIENAKFNYQLGDAPQATAWVAIDDMDKYEIAYECWQQFENNEPVAAWYSDNDSHGSLPTITAFESGKSYVYSLMLKPKDGYSFSSETVITVNGQRVSAPFVGGSMYVPAVKTITMPTIKVIDVVEINDATVSFKDGDKPVFTGDVPDDVYYVLRAAWWELNSTTGLISTEPEFGSGIYENKITTFEAGKTYHYGVYVVAYGDVGNIRYVFGPDTKLKINGEFVNYTRYEGDTSDGSDGTMWVLTDLTMTPQASGTTPEYKITEGANSSWTKNTDATLKFVANGDLSKLVGVKVDGALITADKYTAVSGSTVITLKNDYLDTLSVGKHTLTVVYNDGECSTEFEIKAAPGGGETTPANPSEGNTDSPKTGDTSNLTLWIVLLLVSGGAAVGTTLAGTKKKHNR